MVGGRLSVVASLRGVSQAIKPTPSSSVASSESQVFHPIICDVQFIMIKGQGELGYEFMRVLIFAIIGRIHELLISMDP